MPGSADEADAPSPARSIRRYTAAQRMPSLYYITRLENLRSILDLGILSHDQVVQRGLHPGTVYDKDIVARRGGIRTPNGKTLHHYANVYFQPRNAMLYRVLHGVDVLKQVVVLQLRPETLDLQGALVTDGNAAHSGSTIYPRSKFDVVWKGINQPLVKEYWSDEDGSKRKMMAECLIPDVVPSNLIDAVLVGNEETVPLVRAELRGRDIPVLPQRYQFFQPLNKVSLTRHLALVRGDLFFSAKQTLTISVNCVGIMGKGLAARAKYQFPGVYVAYQDMCRRKAIRLGRPRLHKPEISVSVQLADEWNPSRCSRNQFLLFPTKHHWRERSQLAKIEEGLDWLVANYKAEGIESLAIPALGCGLGGLKWAQVGPAMCQRLSKLDVPVWVYLPAENGTTPEELTKAYLLPTA